MKATSVMADAAAFSSADGRFANQDRAPPSLLLLPIGASLTHGSSLGADMMSCNHTVSPCER
jgi:hypothetical protein